MHRVIPEMVIRPPIAGQILVVCVRPSCRVVMNSRKGIVFTKISNFTVRFPRFCTGIWVRFISKEGMMVFTVASTGKNPKRKL